jgi:hypothetical protein
MMFDKDERRLKKLSIALKQEEFEEWLVAVGQRNQCDIIRGLMNDWIKAERLRKQELQEISHS